MSQGLSEKAGTGFSVRQAAQKNVPKLRFPGFAGKWEEKKFNELFTSIPTKGYQVFSSSFLDEGSFPVVDQGNSLVAGYSNESSKLFREVPVVVFGDHTTSLNYVDFPFVVGADGTKILSVKESNARFGFYALLSSPIEQEGYKRHYSILKDKRFNIPALPEQQKIAAFLGAVDAKLAALAAKQAALVRFKAGLMQKLFSQQLRFTRDDGGDFPDWVEKRLGEVTAITKGKQLNRDTLEASGQYPVINGGITPSGYNDEFNTEAGTITISEGGNSCGYVGFQNVPFWSGGHCYALSPYPRAVLTDFLYQALKFTEISIMRLRVGSGLPNIQKGDLSKFLLPIPHPDEQAKIASALSAMDAKIQAVADQATRLQTFKKGLLQQMFV